MSNEQGAMSNEQGVMAQANRLGGRPLVTGNWELVIGDCGSRRSATLFNKSPVTSDQLPVTSFPASVRDGSWKGKGNGRHDTSLKGIVPWRRGNIPRKLAVLCRTRSGHVGGQGWLQSRILRMRFHV